jgi:glutamyl-tRNA synthetase
MYVGRYAPSPTGDLHMGNALAAVCAWARARRAGGRIVLRMDDLDQPRVVAGSAERIERDLGRLGLDFDAGPGSDDAGAPYVQSACGSLYGAALSSLRAAGRLYACRCSRKDIQRAASAPHAGEEGPAYPGTCRDEGLPFDDPDLPVSWRFVVEPGVVEIEDELAGPFAQDVAAEVGDFIVRRKDGIVAYHLACVVDDARQGVTEVARGRDLLDSVPRQLLLYRALDLAPPSWAHIPLWVGADGHRLAKRRGDETLAARLDGGVPATELLGRMGRALGVCGEGEQLSASALAERLDDATLRAPAIADDGPLPS